MGACSEVKQPRRPQAGMDLTMPKPDLPKTADPRDPRRTALTIILVLVVLSWCIWVLVRWPDSIVLH
jgi:hypothetical protein